MAGFRDLIVWQKAHQLALVAYRITANFPPSEQFALRDQIRRAAASVPANIAEGKGRETDRAFAHFLDVARGSVAEAQALVLLARDLHYISSENAEAFLAHAEEVAKMVAALSTRCRKTT
ncbi:MAG: four helix bundle protein [candidate division WS1 bacterium]|nr:four helix bundle protein [candidate division WS1 bacterium]